MSRITFTLWDDDGCETEYSLPAKNEVCSRCDGEGKHVNPSIDGNGITWSEWAELCDDDFEFPDRYMGGFYDVKCEACKGNKVVKVVDDFALTPEEKKVYERWLADERERRRFAKEY